MCPTGGCSRFSLLQVCREMSHLELVFFAEFLNYQQFISISHFQVYGNSQPYSCSLLHSIPKSTWIFPAPAPRAILHEHRRMCQAAPVLFVPYLPVPEHAPALSVTVRKTPDRGQAHSAFLLVIRLGVPNGTFNGT